MPLERFDVTVESERCCDTCSLPYPLPHNGQRRCAACVADRVVVEHDSIARRCSRTQAVQAVEDALEVRRHHTHPTEHDYVCVLRQHRGVIRLHQRRLDLALTAWKWLFWLDNGTLDRPHIGDQQAMADNFPPQTQEAARDWVRRHPKATAGEAAEAFRLRDAYSWFRLLHGGPTP